MGFALTSAAASVCMFFFLFFSGMTSQGGPDALVHPSAGGVTGLIYQLILLSLLAALTLRGEDESRRRRGWRNPAAADIAFIPVLLALTLGAGALIGQRTAGVHTAEPSISFVLFALMSAAVEEMYFRSWLISEYGGAGRPGSGRNWAAAVLSSLGFALLHHRQGWFGVIYAAAAGMLYAIFFLYRRNIPALILSHWLHNILAVILSKNSISG